jgi:hypothetical protein
MDASRYSPAVRELLAEDRLFALGPGRPNEPARPRLAALTVAQLFAPEPVRRADLGGACLAGLWLYHDFLDESHGLSQNIDTPDGSYWHGLMHRREPDYSNAAYWFRRVGRHPVFEALAPAAAELARTSAPDVTVPAPWDPFWFIDFCEACARGKQRAEQFARLVQRREWELLFDHCYRNAVGDASHSA